MTFSVQGNYNYHWYITLNGNILKIDGKNKFSSKQEAKQYVSKILKGEK
jgi:hypothetical protein